MPRSQADYDTPWKDILEQFFEPFMHFYFPDAYAQIDWEAGFIFKDKELQKVTRRARIGRLTVDKLVQVGLKSGQELWVLIHIEVQSQHDTDFAKRVFVSNYRLFDGQDKPVASLVILSDASSEWRPSEYGYSVFGSHMQLRFPCGQVAGLSRANGSLRDRPESLCGRHPDASESDGNEREE